MSPASAYLLETFVTLAAVLAVAALVLFGARALGVGAKSGPLELVGRLPLDARRVIYLVRIGPQVLVVGASEAGLTKLGEVDGAVVGDAPPPPRPFAEVLRRVRGAGRAGGPESSP